MNDENTNQSKSWVEKALDFNRKTDKVWYKFSVIIWIVVIIYVLLVIVF